MFLPLDSPVEPSAPDSNTSINEEFAHLFEDLSEETQVIALAGLSSLLLRVNN